MEQHTFSIWLAELAKEMATAENPRQWAAALAKVLHGLFPQSGILVTGCPEGEDPDAWQSWHQLQMGPVKVASLLEQLAAYVAHHEWPSAPLWLANAYADSPCQLFPVGRHKGARALVLLSHLTHDPTQEASANLSSLHTLAMAAEPWLLLAKNRQQYSQTNERFNAIVQALPIGLFTQSPEGVLTFCNKAFASMTGQQATELTGKRLEDILQEDQTKTYRHKESGHSEAREYYVTFAQRQHHVMVGRLCPEYSGSAPVMLGYMIDIEDYRQIEHELQLERNRRTELANSRDRFFAVVSHQLRNPVHVIQSIARLLYMENPRPDQMELLNTLAGSSARLVSLVNNLNDFGDLIREKIQITKREFSLKELLEDLLSQYEPKASEKGLRFVMEIAPNVPPVVTGDKQRIMQVMEHLLENAVKFTNQGEVKLHLTTQYEQAGSERTVLVWTISDTGQGIAPQNLDKIFNASAHVLTLLVQYHEGVGVGLHLAQRLTEMMEGRIQVNSEPEKGTVFTVFIPVGIAGATNTRQPIVLSSSRQLEQEDAFRGLQALFADDLISNQLLTLRFLNNWGVSTDMADNGETAFRMVQRKKYDLILIDTIMPGTDVWKTIWQIRNHALSLCTGSEIIVLGEHNEHTSKMMAEINLEHCLPKPIDPQQLYQLITTAFPSFKNNATETANEQIANYEFLELAAEGDKEFIQKMLNMTAQEFEDMLRLLEQAVATQNAEEIRRLKHKAMPHMDSFRLIPLKLMFGQLSDLMYAQAKEAQINSALNEMSAFIMHLCREFRDKSNTST
jgi:PAS domain S-box-containing protein